MNPGERRRRQDYGLGAVGDLRRNAHDVVEKHYPIYGRINGEYVDRHAGKTPPSWPERTKPADRPQTNGVPSFPTGGIGPDVGGVAGCPDAIKFLRSINSATTPSGGAGGGDGNGQQQQQQQQQQQWRQRPPPTPHRLKTGSSYGARRAEADAAVENLLSAVKSKRPAPHPDADANSPSRAPPWNTDDAAAAAMDQMTREQQRQPRHGDEGYRYSRGGLPPAWGKMGAPPATGGTAGENKGGRAAYVGPPVGTPLDQAAMKKHIEHQRLVAAAAGDSGGAGGAWSPMGARRGGTGRGGGTGAGAGTGSRLPTGASASASALAGAGALSGGPGTPSRSRGGVSTSRGSRPVTGAGVVAGINLDDDTTEARPDAYTYITAGDRELQQTS